MLLSMTTTAVLQALLPVGVLSAAVMAVVVGVLLLIALEGL